MNGSRSELINEFLLQSLKVNCGFIIREEAIALVPELANQIGKRATMRLHKTKEPARF
jgi:hypothetical protein